MDFLFQVTVGKPPPPSRLQAKDVTTGQAVRLGVIPVTAVVGFSMLVSLVRFMKCLPLMSIEPGMRDGSDQDSHCFLLEAIHGLRNAHVCAKPAGFEW